MSPVVAYVTVQRYGRDPEGYSAIAVSFDADGKLLTVVVQLDNGQPVEHYIPLFNGDIERVTMVPQVSEQRIQAPHRPEGWNDGT